VIIHLAKAKDVTPWATNFYLYLLAKNDMVAEARPIVAKLETLGRPGIDRFLEWYVPRFELQPLETQQITDAIGLD
jgi:hypothetical protein